MKIIAKLAAAASALALAGAAFAQTSETYDNVDAVNFETLFATIEIEVRDGPVSVSIEPGEKADYPIDASVAGGVLTIRSDNNPDRKRWWKDVNWRRDEGRAFEIFLEQYPTVVISAPAGTDLSLDRAVARLTAGDLGGDFKLDKGHVRGAVGDLASADIGIHGSGDLAIGDVAGDLNVSIHGSGDFKGGDAGRTSASIHGSGDIALGAVRGPLDASIHGSGDMIFSDIDGEASFSTHGSGDAKAGAVNGGVDIDVHGSGDTRIDRVAGKTSVSINGSGDVMIEGGEAADLKVRLSGSGDFTFRGVATNPDLVGNGSGDIRIARHEGTLRASGSGDIIVDDRNYSDD